MPFGTLQKSFTIVYGQHIYVLHKIQTIVQRDIFHYCLNGVDDTSCFRGTFRRSIEPSHESHVFADSTFCITEYFNGHRLAQDDGVKRLTCHFPMSCYHFRSEDPIVASIYFNRFKFIRQRLFRR